MKFAYSRLALVCSHPSHSDDWIRQGSGLSLCISTLVSLLFAITGTLNLPVKNGACPKAGGFVLR